MSDYEDFCRAYGGCPSDPDFMDDWLSRYAGPDKDEISDVHLSKELTLSTTDILPKGKLVHMVKLTGGSPAKAEEVKWDFLLPEDVSCRKANHLRGVSYDDPARWFVVNGFTVRSMKEKGFWFQLIFKDSNSETQLTDAEKSEYESIAFPKS